MALLPDRPKLLTWLRTWVIAFAGYTALALLLFGYKYLDFVTRHQPIDWRVPFVEEITGVYLALLLLPASVWAARRWPPRRRGFPLLVLRHLLAACAIGFVHTTLMAISRQILFPREFPARILPARIFIDTGDRSFFLAPEKIARVQAERNYLAIHSGGEAHRVRGTLDAFAAQLDPGRFLRINRSDLVNVDAIAEMRPWFHGESIVLMKDGTELRWTRRFALTRFRPGRPGAGPGDPESIA